MPRPEAVLALSIALWGCGDDQSLGGPVVVDPGGSNGEHIGLCSEGAELELIDDMEDGRAGLLRINDRAGNWFAFNDDDADDLVKDGEQVPQSNTTFPMARLDPPREQSSLGVNTYGSGFVEWGAGVGFDISTGEPYDASPYLGIAFWARRGPDSVPTVRLDVTDHNTAPEGNVCDKEAACNRSGKCDPSLLVCYDTFGTAVELNEEWTFYQYRWPELEQAGWSGNRYPAIVETEIFGVRFQTDPDVDFDIWIDDVAFVCR